MFKHFIGFVSLAALAFVACMMARAYAEPAPKIEGWASPNVVRHGSSAVDWRTAGTLTTIKTIYMAVVAHLSSPLRSKVTICSGKSSGTGWRVQRQRVLPGTRRDIESTFPRDQETGWKAADI